MALVAASVLLSEGATHLGDPVSAVPFRMGFGAFDSRAVLRNGLPQGGSGGLVSAVLLANLPQAIINFLYLMYNGLFTCMCLAHEYNKYGLRYRKKPLRVTTPHGQQREFLYLRSPSTCVLIFHRLVLLLATAIPIRHATTRRISNTALAHFTEHFPC